jgi:dTDP-4-dehydrorhamnose reductase
MLGSKIYSLLSARESSAGVIAGDIDDVDITSKESLSCFVDKHNPDVIINCAAYTAVDLAEENQEIAYRVNALGPKNLAEVCADQDIKLVHFSTDYVYNGMSSNPYSESQAIEPIGVYGRTKAEGESYVLNVNKNIVIRTAWLYGENGKNFVDTMLKIAAKKPELKVVEDQYGSPTYTEDLAKITIDLIKHDSEGIYHVTNEGSCSWYEFAKEIFSLANLQVKLVPCSTEDYPTLAKRPKYSILSKEKVAKSLGYSPRKWEIALKEYLEKNGKII